MKSPAVHIAQVRRVFRLLYGAGAMLELKKYNFFAETTDYAGQFIEPGRPKLAEHTADAVARLEHPTAQTERGSFVGMFSLYRRFVPNFARLEAPLNEM